MQVVNVPHGDMRVNLLVTLTQDVSIVLIGTSFNIGNF